MDNQFAKVIQEAALAESATKGTINKGEAFVKVGVTRRQQLLKTLLSLHKGQNQS